ncbi:hypothetical protein ElyMa_006049200 [Elysia marginata]|uniref:Uncharacterized protein n=1 Tax=Elysia marginata TaxID=1093978 RepID=A0AAV4GNQ3_9GAST|nr:hypothetical protein ElyMa_006049200 [Elysia marginata]
MDTSLPLFQEARVPARPYSPAISLVSAKIKGQSSNQVMSPSYMTGYSQITPTGQGYYPGSASSLSYGTTGTVPGYVNEALQDHEAEAEHNHHQAQSRTWNAFSSGTWTRRSSYSTVCSPALTLRDTPR